MQIRKFVVHSLKCIHRLKEICERKMYLNVRITIEITSFSIFTQYIATSDAAKIFTHQILFIDNIPKCIGMK